MSIRYRYHHIGIPTEKKVAGMVYIEHLKIRATDHESNPFRIQWMKYENGCRILELVRKVAHVAFEVENLPDNRLRRGAPACHGGHVRLMSGGIAV